MKLESLNNPKYSLTPEKMGQLVEGRIYGDVTGPCGQYSADAQVTRTNGDDLRTGKYSYELVGATGANDATICENWLNRQLAENK